MFYFREAKIVFPTSVSRAAKLGIFPSLARPLHLKITKALGLQPPDFICFLVFSENCPRVLEFINSMEGRTLVGHVFKRIEITSPDVCEINCFVEADCVSFNVGPLQDEKYWCELSNSDHIGHPEDLVYGGVGTTYKTVVVRVTNYDNRLH